MVSSYGKIYSMGHREARELFTHPVTVEEKVDGSQFSFGVYGGELKCRSKGCEIVIDAPDKLFANAVATIRELAPLLRDGWTYRGEYLSKPKHNTLAYDRIPKSHIVIFDIDRGENDYMGEDERAAEAERIGLEVVPVFFVGTLKSPEEVLSLLEKASFLGGQRIEGMVFKSRVLFGADKKPLMAKHVSDRFKEMHQANWKPDRSSGKDVIQLLIGAYRTPARFEKAVQHLRDEGKLEVSPRDIGPLIKELQKDFKEECLPEVAEKLLQWALPDLVRGLTAGFPEWYKERLLAEQFEPETLRVVHALICDSVSASTATETTNEE